MHAMFEKKGKFSTENAKEKIRAPEIYYFSDVSFLSLRGTILE